MRAVSDQDHEPLERWFAMKDAETGVVWDAHVGGYPVCMLGLESRPIARAGFVPADGPDQWTGGTLFPRSSKKVARAINAASGNRPLVVLANLSGFDGSPESMREWQLEFGAEIGRAVVNFEGPIVFVVVSRYHGGAFVVFSAALNENMEIAALEGTYASVIGGAPAAAVVFARDVKKRTQNDERVRALDEEIARAEQQLEDQRRAYFGPEGELFKEQQNLMRPIQERVLAAVEEVATREGYDYVFDKSGDFLFMFAREQYDLSNQVLEELGIDLESQSRGGQ